MRGYGRYDEGNLELLGLPSCSSMYEEKGKFWGKGDEKE